MKLTPKLSALDFDIWSVWISDSDPVAVALQFEANKLNIIFMTEQVP